VQVSSFIAIIITSLITLSYYLGYFEIAFVATLLLAAQIMAVKTINSVPS
jgi:hypothetical protein